MKKKESFAVTLVIPAFNEAARIEANLQKISAFRNHCDYHLQCIIVNDGSRDQTETIVTAFARHHSWLRLINQKINHGKGNSVKTGIETADTKYIFFTDADLAAHLANLNRALPLMQKGVDIVIGSRKHPHSVIPQAQSLTRKIMSRLGNRLIRTLTGLPYRDTQCGFKGFSKKAAQDIFPEMTLQGYLFDVELLLLARQKDYIIREIPVLWSHVSGGTFKPLQGFTSALRELIQLKIKLSGLTHK